jgi:hypothetical protein
MGQLRRRSWFFEKTATALKRGLRFVNGDRPPQSTMDDLLTSTVFKTESTDKAKEDTGGFKAENNGHTVLATDAQVRNYESKKADRAISVQPSQITEVAEGENTQPIGDYDISKGIVIVEKDDDEKRRNKFNIKLADTFANWLNENLSGKFLESLSFSQTESLEDDVDIVTVLDATSLDAITRDTIAEEMTKWYNGFIEVNPWYQGQLYIEVTPGTSNTDELWLRWPNQYGLLKNRKKCLMVCFIDEARAASFDDGYHSETISALATEGPTTTYKADYDNFVSTHYSQFEYFSGIIYGIPAENSDENAMFHSHTYKAVTKGTVPAGTYIESPTVVSKGSTLKFIETSNPYSAVTGPNGSYDGLSEYGWAELHDFGIDDINTKLTADEFNARIQNTLFGTKRVNTVNTVLTATMSDEEEIDDNFNIEIPVAQPVFEEDNLVWKNVADGVGADFKTSADGDDGVRGKLRYAIDKEMVYLTGSYTEGGAESGITLPNEIHPDLSQEFVTYGVLVGDAIKININTSGDLVGDGVTNTIIFNCHYPLKVLS